MRRFLFLFLILCSTQGFSQSDNQKEFIPDGVRQYQFNLDKPAKSLDKLFYEPGGEPVKGTLSPDGSRVIIEHYKKGKRVKAEVVYMDGLKGEVIKSPCYIDPVTYEL